jgi:(2Fe-2S) ferredoxin
VLPANEPDKGWKLSYKGLIRRDDCWWSFITPEKLEKMVKNHQNYEKIIKNKKISPKP